MFTPLCIVFAIGSLCSETQTLLVKKKKNNIIKENLLRINTLAGRMKQVVKGISTAWIHAYNTIYK